MMQHFPLSCVLALCSMTFPVAAQQQPQQPPQNQNPRVTATIQSIQEEGRKKVLVVANDEGQTMPIQLGRIPIDIKADGDRGFLRQGTFIGGKGVLTNEMLFVSQVNVLLPGPNQKVPRGRVRKAPRQAGASQNTYQFIGTIQAIQPNPDYPDYTMVAIDAPGRYPPINLEKSVSVKVVASDPNLLKEGMTVQLDGQLRRGKFQVTKITANRSEPFKSEEVFKNNAEEGKASKE